MKKKIMYMMAFMMALVLAWGTRSMSVNAATVRTGTLGVNGGVQWSYDESTKTLTVTGEDKGIYRGTYSSPFHSICSDVKKIVLQDFKPIGCGPYFFAELSELETIEMRNFDTSDMVLMQNMFQDCTSLRELDLSGFDTSNVINMNGMFAGCSSLTGLDLSGFNTGKVTDMGFMFNNCSSLTSLNIKNFDTGNVTNMNNMFGGCSSLKELDVSNFDTGNVQYTGMAGMFEGCSSLTKLDLSNFDTSKVCHTGSMFNHCTSLTDLDLSSFDTSGVVDMSWMFCDCSSLTSLDLSNFNTSNVTDMRLMFYGCKSLQNLDVSSFDTRQVTMMNRMFHMCSSLTALDLSSFDMSKATYMDYILDGCSGLKVLHTPKDLPEGLTISLPEMFWDSKGNVFEQIGPDNSNTILSKKTVTIVCPEEIIQGNSVQLFIKLDDEVQDVSLNQKYKWSVSPAGRVEVSSTGMANAVSRGTVTITLSTMDGSKVLGKTTVTARGLDKVILNTGEISNWEVGQTGTFTVYVNGSVVDRTTMTWTSSNPAVATCIGGELVGVGVGTTTISCTKVNGTTATCKVTVLEKLTITGQPVSQSVLEGNSAVFKVTAKGDGLSYQWQQKAAGASSWTSCGATGATTASMTVSAALANNGYQYRCVIMDGRGNTVTSNAVTLTVLKKLAITGQPTGVSIEEGNTAVFKVTAKGDNVSYQWQQKAAGASTWTSCSATGAKTASMTVSAALANNGYRYRCVLTDGRGNTVTSNAVTLMVLTKLAITGQPTGVSIEEGNNAVFKVTAKGDNVSYQWQFRTSSAGTWANSGMTGAKTGSITVQGTAARNGYQYRCVITDGRGNKVTSNAVTLSVVIKLAITGQPTGVSIEEGKNAVFKVTAKGNDLSYQWQVKTTGTSSWTNSGVTGAKTASMTVQGTTARNGYQYRCVITDGRGNKMTSNAATLTVAKKLAITGQPKSQSATEGANATFKVTATGSNLSYQWQVKTAGATSWTNSGMTGAKTSSITVQGTTARNGYQYRCVITDGRGNKVTSNAATLTVAKKLAITGQPTSQSVTEGANAVFKVTATGSKISYQWQVRTSSTGAWTNSGMTGSNTASITVQGTTARNGYQYRCVITDENGNKVTSNAATLTVAKKLTITGQPASQSVTEGANAVFKVTATGSKLSYQWQFRTSASGTWKNSGMTGANTNSITVQGTNARNGYQYRCVITDGKGNKVTSNGATLTVK